MQQQKLIGATFGNEHSKPTTLQNDANADDYMYETRNISVKTVITIDPDMHSLYPISMRVCPFSAFVVRSSDSGSTDHSNWRT